MSAWAAAVPVAGMAGVAAALLQLAGALKTTPPVTLLPFDLTLATFALLLPSLALLAVTRRWEVMPAIGLPVAAAALLCCWLVVTASWTSSREVAAQKLPEVALLGPVMMMAGLLVGAEPLARRALCATSLLIGLLLALAISWQLTDASSPLLAEPEAARIQYQLAGLTMAMAAALAALHAVEARSLLARGRWLLAVAALAAASLLPGGRTALIALGLGVAVAPLLRLRRAGPMARLGWAGLVLGAAALLGFRLLLHPEEVEGLRTLERLAGEAAGLEARLGLWQAALAWAGEVGPFGLGAGGFTIAAGHGERRGLYPHNHALEALAEAGLPGLVLWLGAFGGAALLAVRQLPRVDPGRAARIVALVLPMALTVMVSTDLGNRMAWFALGLALSLGVTARLPAPPAAAEGAHV